MRNRIGHELSAGEQALHEIYERLQDVLVEHGEQLPPFAQRNALKALACLWQVANGLDMDPDQLYDVGA